MAVSQPEIYTIFCLVLGEDNPFPVEIAKDKMVGILKDMIKEKAQIGLPAHQLSLYHVEIMDDEDLVKNVKEKKLVGALRSTMKLADVFTDPPKGGTVHIIAQLPDTPPPRTPPTKLASPIPLSPKPDNEIEALIKGSIPRLQAIITRYFANNVQLPRWQAQHGSDAMRSHIATLEIPAATPSSPFPSLLLHNLGQTSHDPLLADRVERLFCPQPSLRFLCNTSGSGKTRLLLEGLWRNWGFYFTARNKPESIGSSDLEDVLEEMVRLTPLTEENRATAQTENRDFASRRFLLLLYIRMLIFRVYLGCASAVPGGITEEHKGRWLLLQVAPETLLGAPDVFLEHVRKLRGASCNLLDILIPTERESIETLLGGQPQRIFCVLDEAQVPANQFTTCFRSDIHPATARPILRQVIHEWASRLPGLLVSGTGVSMADMETVLGSVVAKEGGTTETVTDVGSFDNEKDQRAYLELYLPPGFLETAPGKALVTRAGYWLRGRHRFTATYLSRLIRTSFESPHSVLDDFVCGMTGFEPPGWDDLRSTIELENPRSFDFSRLMEMSKNKPGLLTTVASFVFEYTFTGKIRGLGGPSGDDMVEYGISRFKLRREGGSRMAETDEPLAILGLVNFMAKQHLTLGGYLMEALNTANASTRGFAFEPFGAYLLARAFSSPRPLSDVFEFVGECKLEDELAELVMLEKSNNNFTCTPFNINSGVRSNHILGFSPSTPDDTLEWLENPRGSAFCFPASVVGPDLILVLRLTRDGTLLRVCVQFKHSKRIDVGKAIRTTNPFNFLSQFRDNRWMTSDPTMRQNLVAAIQNLGTGTKEAGTCGVLRVLFSHPSSPDVSALEEAVKGGNGHPFATVRISNLESNDSDLGQTILLLANALESPERTRKRDEWVETRLSKRRKTTIQ